MRYLASVFYSHTCIFVICPRIFFTQLQYNKSKRLDFGVRSVV